MNAHIKQRRPKRMLFALGVATVAALIGAAAAAPAFADDPPPVVDPVGTLTEDCVDITDVLTASGTSGTYAGTAFIGVNGVEVASVAIAENSPFSFSYNVTLPEGTAFTADLQFGDLYGSADVLDSGSFTVDCVAPDPDPDPDPDPEPNTVFVCKYVGTPGVDETLQTGQNPISVSINAIPAWNGTLGASFADAQGRSVVIAYDTGQAEPDADDCPDPTTPTVIVPDPPIKTDVCGVEDDTFTLPGAQPGVLVSVTDDGTYTAVVNGTTVTVTFVPTEGEVAGDVVDVTYLVDQEGNAIWTLVYTNEVCPVTIEQCPVPNAPTTLYTLDGMYFEDRLNPGDPTNKGTHELVDGGIEITATGGGTYSKSAGYIPVDIPFEEIGSPSLGYTVYSGSSAGLNLVIYKNGVWFGTLVYEPLFDEWWINKVVPGMSAGPNPGYQLAYGTPDEFLQAFVAAGWDVDVKAIGYSLGSGAVGEGLVTSLTIACDTYLFDTPPPLIPVIPDNPSKHDECGVANDTFTLPGAEPGETESVTDEGTYTAVGDPTEGEDVTVTFTPKGGFIVTDLEGSDYEVVEGNAVWTLEFTDEDCPPTPIDITAGPSVTDPECNVDGTLVIPSIAHVTFTGGANGDGPGDYTITASAEDEYILTGDVGPWNLTVKSELTGAVCGQLPLTGSYMTPTLMILLGLLASGGIAAGTMMSIARRKSIQSAE